MKKRKICFVTGSRSEYGLMSLLIKAIDNDPNIDLQIIVTGAHLSPGHGLTYQEIEKDGFFIDYKVEMLLSSDTPSAISKSIGLGVMGFADAFLKLSPDLLLIHGDRYEILAAAIAANNFLIPIAHVAGGEVTSGSMDDIIRHSITKMSWWHFVATDIYRKRVIQLGENPDRVFHVGDVGIDAIKKSKLLSKKALMIETGIKFGKKNLLVTYHPETLEKQTSQKNFKSLLDVLNDLKDVYIIFTMPNADSGSRIIKNMIDEFVSMHEQRTISFTSMGHLNYLSTLKYVDGVVGNSSSGLVEVPNFKIGTINIGDRQTGRLKARSVIDCKPMKKTIRNAVDTLYSNDFHKILPSVFNPYGGGNPIEKIMEVLRDSKLPEELKKEFYDL